MKRRFRALARRLGWWCPHCQAPVAFRALHRIIHLDQPGEEVTGDENEAA